MKGDLQALVRVNGGNRVPVVLFGSEDDELVSWFGDRTLRRYRNIAIYLVAEGAHQTELFGRLGRHKMGKACLYIRRLSDVDTGVLERLVKGSVAELRRRYG